MPKDGGISSIENRWKDSVLPNRRLVAVDLETTGLSVKNGHRIVSLGSVEIVDSQPTGKVIHLIFNPERRSDYAAREVHGFDSYTLAYQEPFEKYALELRDWIGDDLVVAHNASFDVGFLNNEFARSGIPPIERINVCCTMLMFQKWCSRNNESTIPANLDSAINVLGISDSRPDTHDALEDALLSISCYLSMRDQKTRVISLPEKFGPMNFITPPTPVKRNAREVTSEMVIEAMDRFKSKSATAKHLGISATTVNNRLKKL
jgi:DNA polymerase III subunit epsilon